MYAIIVASLIIIGVGLIYAVGKQIIHHMDAAELPDFWEVEPDGFQTDSEKRNDDLV